MSVGTVNTYVAVADRRGASIPRRGDAGEPEIGSPGLSSASVRFTTAAPRSMERDPLLVMRIVSARAGPEISPGVLASARIARTVSRWALTVGVNLAVECRPTAGRVAMVRDGTTWEMLPPPGAETVVSEVGFGVPVDVVGDVGDVGASEEAAESDADPPPVDDPCDDGEYDDGEYDDDGCVDGAPLVDGRPDEDCTTEPVPGRLPTAFDASCEDVHAASTPISAAAPSGIAPAIRLRAAQNNPTLEPCSPGHAAAERRNGHSISAEMQSRYLKDIFANGTFHQLLSEQDQLVRIFSNRTLCCP